MRTPIYAKLRIRGKPQKAKHPEPFYAPIPAYGVSLDTAGPPILQPYSLRTLAGRHDWVQTISSREPGKTYQIPIWRSGYRNGAASKARFNKPAGIALDLRGNLYICDSLNHCIRKLTPHGRISTLVGSPLRGYKDGRSTQARFNSPTGLAIDLMGQLFVVDSQNFVLRKITPQGWASSLPTCGKPQGGICVDSSGFVYYTSLLSFQNKGYICLCRLSPQGETAILTSRAQTLRWQAYQEGDETKPFNVWASSQKDRPIPYTLSPSPNPDAFLDLALDPQGNLYFLKGTQLLQLRLRGELSLEVRQAYWPAGLGSPGGLAVDETGTAYLSDRFYHRIYAISTTGQVQTLIDTSGQRYPSITDLAKPWGMALDQFGRIFTADTGHWRICQIVPPEGEPWTEMIQRFPPYQPYSAPPLMTPWKGFQLLMSKLPSFRRDPLPPEEIPTQALVLPKAHLEDVLVKGNRAQQLEAVREVLQVLKTPGRPSFLAVTDLMEKMLYHPEASVRTLILRELCRVIQTEKEALVCIELLEKTAEPNRVLRKYRVEILAFLGQEYQLYGNVIPLLVDAMKDQDEELVQFIFELLFKIRAQGYESLIDPLVEELAGE